MSSRRDLPCHRTGHTARVGWDNPLGTFFCEVRRGTKTVLWVGSVAGEVKTAEALVALVSPYATIDPTMIEQLRADRAADLDRGPSEFQRAAQATLRRS